MKRNLSVCVCLFALVGCRMEGPPPRTATPTPQNNTTTDPSNNSVEPGNNDLQEVEFREFDLGCPDIPEISAATAEVLPGQWEEEAAQQSTRGLLSSFDLAGAPLYVSGATTIDGVAAPMIFHPPAFSHDKSVIYFHDASVNGLSGTLVLEGVELHVSAGTLSQVAVMQFTVGTNLLMQPGMEYGAPREPLPLPEDWSYAADGYRFAADTGIVAENLVVDTYARGIFIADDGTQQRLTPGEPVTLEGTSTILSHDQLQIQGQVPPTLSVSYLEFGVAGEFAVDQFEVEGIEVPAPPVAMFGSRAELVIEDGRVKSGGEVWLTQVVDDHGFLIPAQVEIGPPLEVAVPLGSEVWVPVFYREKSFEGDAALAELQVPAEFVPMFEVATGGSPLYVDLIIDQVKDAGWAAPIIAVPAAVVGSVLLIVDVFRCLFGGCNPDDQPAPYPIWMSAGATGTFDLKVKGALEPGVYETHIDFIGRNHCTARLPVKVTIQ